MKTTKENKGIGLFFYLIAGLIASAVLVLLLYPLFNGQFQAVQRILMISILLLALVSFFLLKVGGIMFKVIGCLLSIAGFSLVIFYIYQVFIAELSLEVYLFFYGTAIVEELIMFFIMWISRGRKIYTAIGGALPIIISALVMRLYVSSSFVTISCVLIALLYFYISTLYYLDCDDQSSSELIEKSGMVFNIVALFIALYGRFTYSWRRS